MRLLWLLVVDFLNSEYLVLSDADTIGSDFTEKEPNSDGFHDHFVLLSNPTNHTHFFTINRFSRSLR